MQMVDSSMLSKRVPTWRQSSYYVVGAVPWYCCLSLEGKEDECFWELPDSQITPSTSRTSRIPKILPNSNIKTDCTLKIMLETLQRVSDGCSITTQIKLEINEWKRIVIPILQMGKKEQHALIKWDSVRAGNVSQKTNISKMMTN